MAFKVLPAPSGKHRRVRSGRTVATLAGVAVLTTAGALGASAMASPGQAAAAAAPPTALTQVVDVNAAVAHALAGQADAQHKAADVAKAKAAAEAKAAAKARAEAKAAAEKAREAAATKAKAAAEAAAKAKAAQAAAAAAAAAKAKAAAATPAAPVTTLTATPEALSVSTSSGSGYTKPVGDAAIGTGYKVAGAMWSSGYHTGVDFLVGSGTPVHAVAAGTVFSAGADGAYGNDVIIRHADGKYTLYAHLTEPLVSAGQTVTEGQEIGISGATGNVTGPHLHFEVRTTPYYGSDIDPVAYLASHGVTI